MRYKRQFIAAETWDLMDSWRCRPDGMWHCPSW